MLEDRITIATPEGLDLQAELAGLGSRIVAGTVDLVLKLVATGLLAIVLLVALDSVGLAVFVPASFLVLFGYDVLFEVLAQGRTPGKRLTHLRVLRAGGRPVDLVSSAVRNVLRVVDGAPLVYVPTCVGILVTRRNQRPGDLVGRTIVVRERREAPTMPALGVRPIAGGSGAWDVSALTGQDVAMVRSFLERRDLLADQARARVAGRVRAAIAPRMAGPEADRADEWVLEQVLAAREARSAPYQ